MATTNLSNHKIDDTTDMEALRAKLLENNPHLAPEEIANTPEAKGIQESTRAKSRRLKKEEVARNISEIPQSEQTAGILGINTKVAFHELPEGMKVIELTYASQNNKKIETLLNRLDITRPLNTTKAPITNSQDAPTVQGKVMTSFHVVPAEANAHALVQYFQEKNIPAHILLYEASSVPVIRINEEIRPIHPLIAQEKIEKISAKRLDIIRKDGSRANNVNQAETQKIKKFSATHATESSVHHSQSTPEIINERGCTFLIIDINALADDPEAIYGLMEVTSRLSTSQDFQFTTDQDGNLVIIALAERAGGVLGGRWAKSIEIATEGKVNMYIGYGKTQKTEESIVIDNLNHLSIIKGTPANKDKTQDLPMYYGLFIKIKIAQ